MKLQILVLILLLLINTASALVTSNANYTNYVIFSEGGDSISNSNYTTEAIIGQTVIGYIDNNNYSTSLGFLSYIEPEAPAIQVISITLNSPVDNYNTSDNTPSMNYTATVNESRLFCELFVNNSGYGDSEYFTNTGHIDDSNIGGRDVWGDGTYVYLANYEDGLRAYTFNGTDFDNVGHTDEGSLGLGVWGDGTYIYLANYEDGLRAYTFNGTDFDNVGHIDDGDAASKVWGDGTYIYLANFFDGLRAYTFNGTDFVNVGHIHNDTMWGLWGDGTYIYTASQGSGIYAYTFNGTDFDNVGNKNDGGGGHYIWGDGTYIYHSSSVVGLRAYTFNGTDFVTIASVSGVVAARGVWGDGVYIYLANDYLGLKAFTFDGAAFTLVGDIDDGGAGYVVWGYEEYLYLANYDDGLRAYTFATYNNTASILTANSTITDGTYDWYISCTSYSNTDQSDTRTITIDTTNPLIDFTSPTDGDADVVIRNYTYINVSITEINEDTIILNWNGTNQTMTNHYINKTDLSDGNYTYYVWINDTTGHSNQTETRTVDIDYYRINLSYGPPDTTLFRFATCGPDFENASAEPENQTATYGIDYVCNDGAASEDIQIKLSGSLNTGWIWYASNLSVTANLITLNTSYKTIYSSLSAGSCIYVWHVANCSYVSQGPGAYEIYSIIE